MSGRTQESSERLLVAVDGSEGAMHALDWACHHASTAGCDVDVVHVWGYPDPGPRTGISEPYEDMQLEAAQVLHDTVERYVEEHQPAVTIHPRLVQGTVAEVLIDQSHHADLLVVGRRGRTAIAASLLGSVSRNVAERAACPVVVVHPRDHV